jgi:hypothetical protein
MSWNKTASGNHLELDTHRGAPSRNGNVKADLLVLTHDGRTPFATSFVAGSNEG